MNATLQTPNAEQAIQQNVRANNSVTVQLLMSLKSRSQHH